MTTKKKTKNIWDLIERGDVTKKKKKKTLGFLIERENVTKKTHFGI